MKKPAPPVDVLESVLSAVHGWLRGNLPQEWALAWLPEGE